MSKKITFLLLVFVLLFSFSVNSFASELTLNTTNSETEVSNELVFYFSSEPLNNSSDKPSSDICLRPISEDTYQSKPLIMTSSVGIIGSVQFTVTKETANLYAVEYVITTTELVNIISATSVEVKDTSILFPETYMDRPLYKQFPATLLYYGDMGNFQAGSNLSKVRVKANDLKVYSLQSGWLSGFTFNSTVAIQD